jgi:hypothetical protein
MAEILSAEQVAAIADAERLMADTVGLPPAARCGEGDDCACCFCQEAIYAAGYKALRAERDAAVAALDLIEADELETVAALARRGDAAGMEVTRLRTALERIASMFGSRYSIADARESARQALRSGAG